MEFGHLNDKGMLVKAKMPIVRDGVEYITEDPELLLSLGEKELVPTTHPSSYQGSYSMKWKETETQIIQDWVFTPYTESELKTRYKRLCNSLIHKKYTVDQEIGIVSDYSANPTDEDCKAAFDEHYAYVEECKAKAYALVYGKDE